MRGKELHTKYMNNPLGWAFHSCDMRGGALANGISKCPLKRSQGAAFYVEGSFGRAITGVLVSDLTRLENGEFKIGFLKGANVFVPPLSLDVIAALDKPVTAEQLFEDGWRVD